MKTIILILVLGVCFTIGYNTYNSENQNTIFNRRRLALKDVKEYNHFCGKLIYGFAIAATIALFMMLFGVSWVRLAGWVLLVIASVTLVKYYNKKEITFLRGH